MSEKKTYRRYNPFPRSLRDCLQPTLKASQKARGFADSRLLTDWEKIVGSQFATQCIPLKISTPRQGSEATLTLRVAPGFALLIQHQEPVILERIAQHFGYRAVTRITLVQAPLPVAPTARQPLPLLSKIMPSRFAPLLENIKDEALHATLSSFAAALSHRNSKVEKDRT